MDADPLVVNDRLAYVAEHPRRIDQAAITALITSFRGHGAWLSGRVGPLIGLTRAALRDPTVYVGQRAYDSYQLARGHVVVGDHSAAVEALAQGADLAAEAVGYVGPRPPWHYYRDQAFFDLEAGVVHSLFGRTRPGHVDEAVRLLGRGLAALPDEMKPADWTGMYRYHLGVALVNAGAREKAEDELDQLRTLAAATESTRARAYAHFLSAALTRSS